MDKSGDPYPWLEPTAPRRKMTDRQTIEGKMALNQSCLSKKQQEEVCGKVSIS